MYRDISLLFYNENLSCKFSINIRIVSFLQYSLVSHYIGGGVLVTNIMILPTLQAEICIFICTCLWHLSNSFPTTAAHISTYLLSAAIVGSLSHIGMH